MSEPALLDLDRLLAPVSPERPGGEDLRFASVYDEIRDARTEDDSSLAAGVWARELKTADWQKVADLAAATLAEHSKDLQIAGWLAEAQGRLHGFEGLEAGLRLVARLLAEYPQDLHPIAEDGDLEARANCLGWLNGTLARQVRGRPLTADGHGWYDWQGALETDNQGLRDRNAKAARLAEGKLDGESWDKLVAATPDEHFAKLHAGLAACRAAFDQLETVVDTSFGADAPSLRELGAAIDDVRSLVLDIAKARGLATTQPPPEPPASPPERAPKDDAPMSESPAAPAALTPMPAPAAGDVLTREAALKRLTEIAQFFRRTEPHSPVAYLLERAVKWADLPLDLWLQQVVKDAAVLSSLNETLGLKQDGQ